MKNSLNNTVNETVSAKKQSAIAGLTVRDLNKTVNTTYNKTVWLNKTVNDNDNSGNFQRQRRNDKQTPASTIRWAPPTNFYNKTP